jgi:diguanylate cyclase (GGDEF)-like protein
MFSFSQFDEDDLFQKYKRQTYLLAFPFGALLCILFAILEANNMGIRFYIALIIVIELILLTLLVWRAPRLLAAVELTFYFSLITYFFLLTQIEINILGANGSLNSANLGDQLNSLGMWLIVFMLAAFLTMKPQQARLFTIYMVVCVLGMAVYNIWFLLSRGLLDFRFVFQWINPLFAMAVTILLIQRMGVLQQRHASSDALTGIMNRRALYTILVQEFERARRYKKPFFIVLFDVDLFKHVNDTHGHVTGDKVLVEMTKFVSQSIRQSDHLGRWGGEEFLLILPETEIGPAYTLAERLRKEIAKTSFANVDHITVSFGIALYQPDQSLEDVLRCADDALYKAKHNGRNQVVVNYTCK